MAFAGAVYAQTTSSTTSSSTSTTSSSTSSTSWPFGPFLGPLLGTPNQNTKLNAVCHDRATRHELITWYKQLPTDQKNALVNDLKQAYSNWYNQLPQDEKDKLQSIVNQSS